MRVIEHRDSGGPKKKWMEVIRERMRACSVDEVTVRTK